MAASKRLRKVMRQQEGAGMFGSGPLSDTAASRDERWERATVVAR